MYVIFEEAGKFISARVLNEADKSLQAELSSGKRVKLKTAQALIRFETSSGGNPIEEAEKLSASMDLDLLWEFAPIDEFGFEEIAQEYFSSSTSLQERCASLMALFGAPHYFRRAGPGRFKKADAQTLKLALAAIENKKQLLLRIDEWASDLQAGICPDPIKQQLYKNLFKPDKNSAEYKAVLQASRAAQLPVLDLLKNAQALTSAHEFHWQRFVFEHCPASANFPAVLGKLDVEKIKSQLDRSTVQAFSIDDSQTTEIDDALSVQGLGTGRVTLGIHIAAPSLALSPDDALDKIARQRLSTVYMPGHKITMLPDEFVQAFTLQEGRDNPALSLYIEMDEQSLEILSSQTRLEQIFISHNLRHDLLEDQITENDLLEVQNHEENTDFEIKNDAFPLRNMRKQLSFLYRLAKHLKALREQVRGKPEVFNRPDYNFKVSKTQSPLQGNETIAITERKRGSPLDLMVAETMILANSTWGLWLAQYGVPGIYRSQASLAPGVKVRMGSKALPHAGIGVKAYAWSTSPLRRYTDLVNQWQLIECVKHGATAALAAPFKPKDASLFAIISSFESAYSAYNSFQNQMEMYWTMEYISQQKISEVTAVVLKENLVRAESIPLVLEIAGIAHLPRGSRVKVRMTELDRWLLNARGQFVEQLLGNENTAEFSQAPEDDEPVKTASLHLAFDEEAAENFCAAGSKSDNLTL